MKLYFSPYSKDTIKMLPEDCGLICSVSQVNADIGYTGFTFESLREFTQRPLYVDHLGKGGEDCERIIKQVIDAGWQGVHLHTEDLDLIRYLTHEYDIEFELGTGEDEVDGDYITFMENVLRVADTNKIKYLSFPTGCKIEGTHNINKILFERGEAMRKFGYELKGHNSDYINQEALLGINVDALNIAPQLGVLMTRAYIQYARIHGLKIFDWEDEIIQGNKWKKWTQDESLAIDLGGQYHFRTLPSEVQFEAYDFVKAQVDMLIKHLQSVTRKRWGWELIVEENDRYQVKKLCMRDGEHCSLHYHNHKRETLTVLQGQLKIDFDNGSHCLAIPGKCITLSAKNVHRMTAIDTCIYLESAYSGCNEDNVRVKL